MATALLVLLTLAYPLLVYFGLLHFSPQWVGAAIAALLTLRLIFLQLTFKSRINKDMLQALYPAILLAIGCSLASILLNQADSLKLIPVVINTVFLLVFISTLRYPPSMIERLARLQEPQLNDTAIHYTRQVTKVWCVFFLLNGSVSLYTALFASMEIWTLYNGLIAYLLMGILFSIEYLIRIRVKARAEKSS
jgi:uncharacterized membrane protein